MATQLSLGKLYSSSVESIVSINHVYYSKSITEKKKTGLSAPCI